MIAAEFEDVRSDSESPFSHWLVPALIVSILLHLLFWYWARGFSLPSSGREVYDRIVPRTFHLERVEIDSELLAPDAASEKQKSLAPESVNLPDEKTAFEKLMADNKGEPAAPKIDQAILSEKPTASSTSLEDTAQMAKRSGAQSILEDTRSLGDCSALGEAGCYWAANRQAARSAGAHGTRGDEDRQIAGRRHAGL